MRYYLPLLLLPLKVFSLPSSPEVVAGKAEVQSSEMKMRIEASDKAILNYSDFSLGAKESIEFVQPSASSSVLNRVTGKNPSNLLGSIESNGRVFLVNEKGVYFGPDAVVNVGSLIVSTLAIQDQEFAQDNLSFALKNLKGQIKNHGTLKASKEGAIVLLAPHIENSGSIEATAGKVVLAGGEKAFLSFDTSGLIDFCVEGEIEDAVLSHLGKIHAPKGSVSISLAKASQSIKEVVNKEGVTSGEVFAEKEGKLYFLPAAEIMIEGEISAEEGAISCDGRNVLVKESASFSVDSQGLDDAGSIVILSKEKALIDGGNFSAKGGENGGNGGLIETSSEGQLLVTKKPTINTLAPKGKKGSWLLDPSLITIGSGAAEIPSGCVDTDRSISSTYLAEQDSNIILCAETIIVEDKITLKPDVSITFTSPPGQIGAFSLRDDIVTHGGDVTVHGLVMTLEDSREIVSSGGNISLGPILSDDATHLKLQAALGTIFLNGVVNLHQGILEVGGKELVVNKAIKVSTLAALTVAPIVSKFPITIIDSASSIISTRGSIGSAATPLNIIADGSFTVGAPYLINIKTEGIPIVSSFYRPCYSEVNSVVLSACGPALFLLPKSWFLFGSVYSSVKTGSGPLPFDPHLFSSLFENINRSPLESKLPTQNNEPQKSTQEKGAINKEGLERIREGNDEPNRS